jgi:hypothetical protein
LNATLVDLLGAYQARSTFPFSNLATGQSLLRPQGVPETLYMSTSTAVWEADDPKYGGVLANRVVVTSQAGDWDCYLLAIDPHESTWRPPSACGEIPNGVMHAFPGLRPPRP